MSFALRVLLVALVLGLASFAAWHHLSTFETRAERIAPVDAGAASPALRGASRFLFDDLGGLSSHTLETNAFPWKVVATALVMHHAEREGAKPSPDMLPAILQRFGWITPAGIDNWPEADAPRLDKPAGIVSGTIDRTLPRIRLEIANMGCAACHAGMSYDAQGAPTGRLWLGSSNTSRFFDGYTRAIFDALRHVRPRLEELLATIPVVFPDVHPDELATIEDFVLPRIVERLDDAESNDDILVQFGHGGAGLTNGIAALKLRLDAEPSLVGAQEIGYASIPDLYGRRLRSSVLYDGLYALDGERRFVERREGDFTPDDQARLSSIVAFFIVPSMGIRPTDSEQQAQRISEILDWLLDYRPQPFPGQVDRALALEGSLHYEHKCASCHGRYTPGIDELRLVSYPNRLVPQAEIGSDPARWQAITDRMVEVIGTTPVAHRVNAANAEGYVAPILNGLWTSAPYLHNGSVPTLWHLLNPAARPAKFFVGGHRLDFARVGIAGEVDAQGTFRYPADYQPWSTPVLIDAAAPGLANGGHEREFVALSDAEKAALIEFLKLL
jgi:hypothetical protein